MFSLPRASLLVLLSCLAAAPAWPDEPSSPMGQPPSAEEMWQIIQQQQRQIEALQRQLEATNQKVEQTDQKVAETDQKVEMTGDRIEQVASTPAAGNWADRTSIGGYGELHYNNLDSKEEIDFHRFVLYFNHEFTDSIRFVSEVELEHSVAGDGQNGEVELEQAYVEFDLNQNNALRAGLFLVPVGILNETHEPPTFYGVERNPVETNIIPTTWWEGGADLYGELAPGFSYNLAASSGLDVPQSGSRAFLIRSGRSKVSEARANDGALTGRLKWTGMPGVELAVTGQYQSDVTQGDLNVSATLFEAHADIRRGPFGLRALYARWDLDKSGVIAASDPAADGRDEQMGWYVEPSIRGRLWEIPGEFGAFVRYNVWDNNAGSSNDTEFKQYNAGFNYWPVPDVVLKFDAQQQDNDSANNDNGFNLGIGYQF
jgi:hypothetical protein